MREMAGTDKQGTNVFGVIKAAEQLGFSAKGVKGDKEAFLSGFPLSCIAHVIVDGSLLHYVEIHKISIMCEVNTNETNHTKYVRNVR